MNWLDLALFIFIAILLIVGIKKGFMTSVLSNFSFSINAILSFFLCKPIGWIYNKCGLGNAIASSYAEKFITKSANFSRNLLELSEEALPDFVSYTLSEGGFSKFTKTLFEWFLNKPSLYNTLHSSGHTSRTISDILSTTYSSFFVTIISFVTSIILLYLIVWLFKMLVNKLRQIGFVKFVDNFLGALYGLFRCFLILIIVCLVIKLLSPFAFMESVTAYISDSFFGNLIYDQINSFIDNYLGFQDIINVVFKK